MKEKSGKEIKHSLFDAVTFSGIGTSRRVVKNAISKSFGALTERFVYASSRAYGIMSLSFGLLSLFVYLGKYYLMESPELPLYELIVGLVFSVLAIPLVLSDKPLCQILQDFAPTDYILFDFLSIKRIDKKDSAKGISAFSAVLVGFIPALLTAFVPTLYIILALGAILFIAISFVTPEFTVIFTVLIAPYLSPIPDNGLTLALLAALSTLSFLTKLVIGKRFYKLEIFDIVLFLLMTALAISGFVNNSPASAFTFIALTLGYVLSSNLVINRRLADCVVNALITSGVPIAVMAIVKYIIMLAEGNEGITNSIVFASSDSFGAFLLLCGIFAVYYAKESRGIKKAAYSAAALLSLFNIILLWKPFVWLSVLILLPAALILKKSRVRKEWLIPLLLLPYLLFLLPKGFFAAISDALSLSPALTETLDLIKSALSLFRENIFVGIGGEGLYVPNTFLSLALHFGVFCAAIIILMYLLRLVQMSEFSSYVKHSTIAPVAKAGMLACFAIFSIGMAADIFSDITLFYLFSSVFGLVGAALRISKNEHDERIGYYGTVSSDDASDVNVRISI